MRDRDQAPRVGKIMAEASAASQARARKPAVFALGESAGDTLIEEEPDFVAAIAENAQPFSPAPERVSWLSRVFWAALGLFVSLYLVDAVWELVLRLQARNPLIGQIALGLAGILGVVLLVLLLREMFAHLRMRRVDHLRRASTAARENGNPKEAEAVIRVLVAFYAGDAASKAARFEIEASADPMLDAKTRLDMVERLLLGPKDEAARDAIAEAASRVSVFTAVSPRAAIDVVFVLAQSFLLIRTLSAIYGGRASGLGLWRLFARIARTIALTGGIAMADTMLGQVLGAGLAARLSAKLGEGVLNGVLVARIGLAAVALCRPMDFIANDPIILSQIVKTIVLQNKVAENPAA